MGILKIENIKGGYQMNPDVLKGVNLELAKGEKHAIIGQNGAGKSSIVNAILNQLPIISGDIFYNNKSLLKSKFINPSIGCFLQGGVVFPNLTVKENLKFSGRRESNSEFKKRLYEYQQEFDILSHEKMNNKAGHLSGGERHQLALLMVLYHKPDLLILDEPSAGLSPMLARKLYRTIDKYSKSNNTTTLLIEQNIQLASEYADRISMVFGGVIDNTWKSSEPNLMDSLTKQYFN